MGDKNDGCSFGLGGWLFTQCALFTELDVISKKNG